eukprot:2629718-Prymnesium_polylepis.1
MNEPAVRDVLRAQRERRTDTALNTVLNSAKNCVLALPPDALLSAVRVARCSAHAACAPDTLCWLKRYDVLQHVGRSIWSSWPAAPSDAYSRRGLSTLRRR